MGYKAIIKSPVSPADQVNAIVCNDRNETETRSSMRPRMFLSYSKRMAERRRHQRHRRAVHQLFEGVVHLMHAGKKLSKRW